MKHDGQFVYRKDVTPAQADQESNPGPKSYLYLFWWRPYQEWRVGPKYRFHKGRLRSTSFGSRLFVCDQGDTHRVQVFALDGRVKRAGTWITSRMPSRWRL